MKHKEIWWDEYRGIRFEINKFEGSESLNHHSSWTFYLHLALEQFPEKQRVKLKPFFYYTAFGTPIESSRDNPIANLEWHGGLTWISLDIRKPFSYIKAGCDYQHFWDEGQFYSVDELVRDSKRCIDSLYEMFPEIKTEKEIWEIHRARFPGEKAGDIRMFDENLNPISYEEVNSGVTEL